MERVREIKTGNGGNFHYTLNGKSYFYFLYAYLKLSQTSIMKK